MSERPDVAAVLAEIAAQGSEANRAGMARYGIRVDDAFGVPVTELRRIAKRLGRDHELALELWRTGNHEARLLAAFVDEPARVDERADGTLGGRLRLVGPLRRGDHRPVRPDALCLDARRPSGQGGPRSSSSAPALPSWPALPCTTRRPATSAFLGLLALVEREAVRRAQLREEGGQLGAAQHRQAQPGAATRRRWPARERIRAAADERAGGPRGGDAGARAARWIAGDALRELRSPKVLARLSR